MSNEYTFQSVFDKLCEGAQTKILPCYDKGQCKYIEGSHRCAAGLFMTQEECEKYDEGDSTSITALYKDKLIIDSLNEISKSLGVDYLDFWTQIQYCHDKFMRCVEGWNISNFISDLRQISYFKDCE